MSGVLKGIGKMFKKVGKFVKKIALPVLAIGAVVLTGGAAVGALPVLGAGGLGLSTTMTAVVTSAAKGALIGAVGSAATGGNILKGASMGALAGGLSGGIGAVAGGAGGGAAAAAGSATGTIAPTAGAQLTSTFGNQLVGALPNVASSAALPSTFGSNLIASLPNVASGGIGGIGAAASGVAPSIGGVLNTTMPMPNPVPGRGGGIGGVLGDIGRGVGGFFKGMDGTVKGQLIAGLGQGLLMNEELKARRKAEEREREQIAANYSNMDGLFRADAPSNTGQDPRSRFNGPVYGKVSYDAQTGRIIPRSA